MLGNSGVAFFRGWSINQKMVVAVGSLVAAGLVIVTLVGMQNFREGLLRENQLNELIISKLVADRIAAPMRFRKTDNIQLEVKALLAQKGPAIDALAAFDQKDQPLISHNGEGQPPVDLHSHLQGARAQLERGETWTLQTSEHLLILVPVFSGQQPTYIGAFGVAWSLRPIQQTIQASIETSLLMSAAIVLVLIGLVILLVRALVVRPITGIVEIAQNMAIGEGDLTQRIRYHRQDELQALTKAINAFIEKVHHVVREVAEQTDALTQIVSGSKQVSDQANTAIQQQRQRLEQIATAVTQMSVSVNQVASNAAEADCAAQAADATSLAGQQTVDSAVLQIRSLSTAVDRASSVISQVEQDSQSIGSIIDVIQGIAAQTNLLALNAAIEAARAGEAGRGFAVVADEVRALANKTQQATETIKQMIEKLQLGAKEASDVMLDGQARVNDAVAISQQAGQALASIREVVGNINERNHSIVAAARSQSKVAEEISRDLNEISALSQHSANSAAESARLGGELALLASKNQATLGRFKI
jgi:methyl-accepting chemotaxis protein